MLLFARRVEVTQVPLRRRDNLLTYLVVGPFAILLAFPFYWMLQTSLKSDLDLYNVGEQPVRMGRRLADARQLPLPLLRHGVLAVAREHGVLVGLVVVAITLVVALPAGYALARLSGRWGQSMGVGLFLVYLVPPTLLFLPLSRVIAEVAGPARTLILVYPGSRSRSRPGS